MNIKISILYRFLFICCLFSACEKDIDYPRKFVFDSYSPGQLKLFTNSGEVPDNKIINSFIEGHEDLFWINPDSIGNEDWNIQIELLSETKARIIYETDTILEFRTTRKDGVLFLEYPDTLFTTENPANCMLKYHPLFIYSTPSNLGGQSWAFVPCIFVIEDGNEIHIPILSFIENIYFNNNLLMSSRGIGNYNNEFNTGYLNSLSLTPLTDTLAYQNNQIIFVEE